MHSSYSRHCTSELAPSRTFLSLSYWVRHSERADAAIFFPSGTFTSSAAECDRADAIQLVDEETLPDMEAALQKERVIESRLAKASAPSQSTPHTAQICPICGSGMVRRAAKRGSNAGQPFLGCSPFPGCKGTRPICAFTFE